MGNLNLVREKELGFPSQKRVGFHRSLPVRSTSLHSPSAEEMLLQLRLIAALRGTCRLLCTAGAGRFAGKRAVVAGVADGKVTRVVARERRETMQGVCGELERCRTPDDQDVVEGLIKKMLSKLPEDFVEKEHETTLRANGLCRVRCVQRLTVEKRLDLRGIENSLAYGPSVDWLLYRGAMALDWDFATTVARS